jgi:GntR family transcriptional regulator
MKFYVDLTRHHPAYAQILEQVKHAIATGELKAGDQLPTVRQLAADLRVNFNTVARAYRLLDEEGIISTQHGRGTFILGPASARDTKRLRKKELAQLAEYFVEEAEKLGFTPKEVRTIIEDQVNAWAAELKSKPK